MRAVSLVSLVRFKRMSLNNGTRDETRSLMNGTKIFRGSKSCRSIRTNALGSTRKAIESSTLIEGCIFQKVYMKLHLFNHLFFTYIEIRDVPRVSLYCDELVF